MLKLMLFLLVVIFIIDLTVLYYCYYKSNKENKIINQEINKYIRQIEDNKNYLDIMFSLYNAQKCNDMMKENLNKMLSLRKEVK